MTHKHDVECYLCATPIELPREMCADCETVERVYDDAVDEVHTALRYLGEARDGKTEKIKATQTALKEALRQTELLDKQEDSRG